MAKESKRAVNKAVRLPGRKGVILPGQERKFNEADLDKASIIALQRKGVVTGFAVDDEESADDLPSIRELKEFLAEKTREEVEELAARDERSSAVAYYEARLRELDEEAEG